MFRKGKKNVGQVTMMDKEDEANRAELFDGGAVDDDENDEGYYGGGAKSIDQMTVQELEDLAIQEAMEGRAGTRRAVNTAQEARTIGIDTAEKLHGQTKQLEKMSEEIEVVHDYLDKGERVIEKMSRPKLVRMFARSKKAGKGLDKVKGSKKKKAKREELRNGGVVALDLEKMRERGGDDDKTAMEDLEREELLETKGSGEGVRRLLRGRKKNSIAPTKATDIKEDHSHYSSGVAKAMRHQDEDLDQISAALNDMKGLANAMNKELEYQGGLIDQVGEFTTETAVRTRTNARRVNKLLK